ncbi:MAG: hypothetical protein QG671_773 [Actinomycetota bacterium]|nr:hypothetical protein [Actinomycetota bacterium]
MYNSNGGGDVPLAQVRFQLLGPVTAICDGQPVNIGGPTARAVLAVLLLRGRAGGTIEDLVESVWGKGGASRESVYHYVSGLRAILKTVDSSVRLELRRPGYRLVVDDDSVDWRRFKRLVADARRARDVGSLPQASALLRSGCASWSGRALSDIGDRLSAARSELEGAYLGATEELAAIEACCGLPERVVEVLGETSASHPGRERMAVLLIEALTKLGQRDEVDSVYRRTYQHLAERGLRPSTALASVHRAALHADQTPMLRPEPTRSGAFTSDLPLPEAIFAGRAAELDQTITTLRSAPSSTATVCAISGMAGTGKTALAIHAARQLATDYPDGCLFVNLHGHSTMPPESPDQVLDRLLRRLGVAGEQIPVHLDDRTALFQQRLDGRRVLVLLDNAVDVAQIRPILPRVSGCAALITSRTLLAALDEAQLLPLDLLPTSDGVTLFRAIVGPRLGFDPKSASALERIVIHCGRLPLAIRIAAARHRSDPVGTITDLCARLDDEHSRLSELDDGDRSVAASLAVSHAHLPPEEQRMFALLGVHPDAQITTHVATALAEVPFPRARKLLDGLVNRHLLTRSAPGRYQFHDLVALFARETCWASLTPLEASQALQRLLDYFLHVAEQADATITPQRHRIPLAIERQPSAAPDVRQTQTAIRWLETEERVLTGVCQTAADQHLDVQCWQLAYTLRGYFFLTKRWDPWLRTHEVALAACRRLGDRYAEAQTLNNLGLAAIEQGNIEVAARHYREALTLFCQVGDEHGEHTARANLAWIDFAERRFDEFLRELRRCYLFYSQAGSTRNAAITLRGIALGETEAGEYPQAVQHLRQVQEVFRQLGSDLDRAMTANALGEAYAKSGEHTAAVSCHQEAAGISQGCGSTFEHARAHHRLGDLAAVTGDPDEAHSNWKQALVGYDELRVPQAREIRIRLAGFGL